LRISDANRSHFESHSRRFNPIAGKDAPAVKRRVIDELTEFCIIVGYLWLLLVVFHLHRFAIMRELNTAYRMDFRIGLALVNAVVLGKVILAAEHFRLGDLFKDQRLVYSILFKSAAFAVLLLVFDVLEEVIVGLVHGKSLAQSIPQLGGGGLEGKLIVCLVAFVTLIPFSAFTEIRRVIGMDNVRAVVLAKRAPSVQTQSAVEPTQASHTDKRMKHR
jgi:hypothetical protein